MQNALQIEYLSPSDIKPYPQQARVHNRKQRRKLEALLRRYGQVIPILVDENRVVVDGHAVLETMAALGHEQIMVVTIRGRGQSEISALRLALNRIPQDASWDNERLRVELTELLQLGFEMELTAFDPVEIDMALIIDEPTAGNVEEGALDELEPGTHPPTAWPGSTWLLGQHAVACGDARDSDLVQRLADGRVVAGVFTDPPYNVAIDGFARGLGRDRHREFAVASGEMSREQFTSFLADFMSSVRPTLADGAIVFVCMDWRHIQEILDAAIRNELELKNLCVWKKSNAGMGSFYRSQHELVFVFKHGTGPHQNHFELGQYGRSRTNVWEYRGVNTFGKDRTELLGIHPTVKPVGMIADALRDVTRRGETILDPFLGSGSTLLAADDIGRRCIGIELDPGYIDVAIRRWQRRTGKDAIEVASGNTFDVIAEARSKPVASVEAKPAPQADTRETRP